MIRMCFEIAVQFLRGLAIQLVFLFLVLLTALSIIPAYVQEREEQNRLHRAVEEVISSPELRREYCEPSDPDSHYTSIDVEQERYFPLRI